MDDIIADNIVWTAADKESFNDFRAGNRSTHPGYVIYILDRLYDRAVTNICKCNELSCLDLILEAFEDYHRIDSGLRCKYCNNRRYLSDIIDNGADVTSCVFMLRYLLKTETCVRQAIWPGGSAEPCGFCYLCSDVNHIAAMVRRGLLD